MSRVLAVALALATLSTAQARPTDEPESPRWTLRSGTLVKLIYPDGDAECYDLTMSPTDEHELYEHGTPGQRAACDAMSPRALEAL